MIDGIINSLLETASPAVTKWRSTFFLLALVLFSPDFDAILAIDLLKVSLEDIVTVVGKSLSSSNFVNAIALAIGFYIAIPQVNFYIVRFFIGKNIKYSEALLERLDKLRKRSKTEVESIISESFDREKNKATRAQKSIDLFRERSEIAIFLPALYITTSLYLGVTNYTLAILATTAGIVTIYFLSRHILLIYLRDIGYYKILEDHIKYFVLIK